MRASVRQLREIRGTINGWPHRDTGALQLEKERANEWLADLLHEARVALDDAPESDQVEHGRRLTFAAARLAAVEQRLADIERGVPPRVVPDDIDPVCDAIEAYRALNDDEQEVFHCHADPHQGVGMGYGECDACHRKVPIVSTDEGQFCAWGCDVTRARLAGERET